MVEKFIPQINKVYFINSYSLFQIISGNGSIQVDFKNYFDWEDKAIFLDKGQYIKFMSDDFYVRKIEFPNEIIYKSTEVRVLFKHLISLGYINFEDCNDCQKFLSDTAFSNKASEIIDISSKQWFWQNPFNANKEEYELIFDLKDIVDENFHSNITIKDLLSLLKNNGFNVQSLFKDRIGITVKKLVNNKKIIEGKKEIVFTDKSIKEISYELGYQDPAYFNRVFKNETGQNPVQFREDFDFNQRDRFSQNIIELIKSYHQNERQINFYADKMNLSVKALSKKVKNKMNTSLGQLIRHELIFSSKRLLLKGENINDIALHLGFKEPNHFSAFFKRYTNFSPTDFKSKKYNS